MPTQPHAGAMRLAIVVNPTKVDDLDAVKEAVSALCSTHGIPDATWYETTEEDPGRGQTQQALEDGATLVCPLGGDGTVRQVASVLVGTDTPLGLLPGGTGNLLARNLDLPLDSITTALETAITGRSVPMDVGTVTFDDDPEEIFLVAVGMGLDADMVAGASENIKAVVGWVAYVFSAAKALFKPGFRATIEAGPERSHTGHATMVMVGNCGEIQGGVALMPDADVTDGLLDTVVMAPTSLYGWGAALLDIVTRHHRGHPRLMRFSSTAVTVRAAQPVQAEIDGDVVGEKRAFRCGVRHGALVVRRASAL